MILLAPERIPAALDKFDIYGLGVCLGIMAKTLLHGDVCQQFVDLADCMTNQSYTIRPCAYDVLIRYRKLARVKGVCVHTSDAVYRPPVKLIGRGSTGSVYIPTLKCDDDFDITEYPGGVSKLMSHKEALDEMQYLTLADNADPVMKYHVGKPIMCYKLGRGIAKATRDCDLQLDRPVVLNYPYGGTTMDVIANGEVKVDALYMFKDFASMFDGLILFSQNKLIHHDIKLINIVYDQGSMSMMLIDFGLSDMYQTVIDDYGLCIPVMCISYEIVPPEVARIYGNGLTDKD